MKYKEAEALALYASQYGWELVLIHQEGKGYTWEWTNSDYPELVIYGAFKTECKATALTMALEQISYDVE
jgi:hypothetical protein